MVICVDNSHLGALRKAPDPSWLALTVAGAAEAEMAEAEMAEAGSSALKP